MINYYKNKLYAYMYKNICSWIIGLNPLSSILIMISMFCVRKNTIKYIVKIDW